MHDINTISFPISLSWRTALLIIAPVSWGSSNNDSKQVCYVGCGFWQNKACLVNNDLALHQKQQIMGWGVYDKQLDRHPDNGNNKIAQ